MLLPGSRHPDGVWAWKPGQSWDDQKPTALIAPEGLLTRLAKPPSKRKTAKRPPTPKSIEAYTKQDHLAAAEQVYPDAGFKGHGPEHKFHCPNPDHDDKNPSASFNSNTGAWNCYKCGVGGGIIELYAIRHKLDAKADFDRIERELAALFRVTLDDADAPKKTKVAEMLEALKARNIQPFSDSNDDTYVDFVTPEGLRDTQRISNFGRYCTFLYYRATGKTISPPTIQEVLAHLDAEARYGGNPPRNPTVRYGGDGNTIFVNLGRPDKKILRIAGDGLAARGESR